MHATIDRVDEKSGLFAYQQKDRLLWRLFQKLENLVGALAVHALWEPHDAHLIAPLARLKAQLSYERIALSGTNLRLLIGSLHVREPLIHSEIRAFGKHLVPLAEKVVADHLVVRRGASRLDHGEREVQVGMSEAL